MTQGKLVRVGSVRRFDRVEPAGLLAEDRMACTRTGEDVEQGDGDLCHEMQLYYE